MDPLALATRIVAVEQRRPGSDAERRAALELAAMLRETGRRRRRTTEVRTIWVRPHHAAIHAGLAALAVAGSVVSVDRPVLGLILIGAAFVLLVGDLSGRLTPLRRLTFERATQNVVARDPREAPVRLVITAAVDAPAPGLLGRGVRARLHARARRRSRDRLPGPYGVLVAALLALLAAATGRVLDAGGVLVGALQLGPTIIVLLAVGAALDRAFARPGRQGANADASAAAVAVALVAALDALPPRTLAVDCVLAGAGGAHALGFRRWIGDQRRAGVRSEQVAVLHVAACGVGRPVVWTRDGLVLGLRLHPRLVALARAAGFAPHTSRDSSGARAARAVGWPAVAVGCVDEHGVAPRLGDDADTVDRLDPAALAATLEGCLGLVRALDAELTVAHGGAPAHASTPPATSARAARRAAAARGVRADAGR